MSLRRLLHLPLLALLLTGCGADAAETGVVEIHNPHDGLWQDADEVPFRFVLEQTFGVEEEPAAAMLASIGTVATDDSGNVYMLDPRSNAMMSFDPNGAFRWKVSARGEGPGELNEVRGFQTDRHGRLFLANQMGTLVDVFNLRGEFLGRHPLIGTSMPTGSPVGMLSADRLVVANPTRKAGGATVSVLDVSQSEWMVESTFDVDHSTGMDYPETATAGMPPVGVFEGGIAVGNISRYRLEFYDRTGQLERIVSRADIEMVRPAIVQFGRVSAVFVISHVQTPVALEGSYHLVYAAWPTNISDPDAWMATPSDQRTKRIGKHTLDLYNADWQLLYAWTTPADEHPGPRSILHVDSEGRVYAAIMDPFISIGRYRVEITPPN